MDTIYYPGNFSLISHLFTKCNSFRYWRDIDCCYPKHKYPTHEYWLRYFWDFKLLAHYWLNTLMLTNVYYCRSYGAYHQFISNATYGFGRTTRVDFKNFLQGLSYDDWGFIHFRESQSNNYDGRYDLYHEC